MDIVAFLRFTHHSLKPKMEETRNSRRTMNIATSAFSYLAEFERNQQKQQPKGIYNIHTYIYNYI